MIRKLAVAAVYGMLVVAVFVGYGAALAPLVTGL
jgi:hypothetical protein